MSASNLAASTALAAVLDAPDLPAARAAARAGLDRLAADSPSDILEVDEAARLAGRTASTVRRWCAERRIGRRLGGRWLVSRRRLAEVLGDAR